ncbi:MAG: VWA domain-containing protein [Pseudomonas sp.]|nr:VWA domain-containing protein [Pseudomonas sp.]
MVTLLNSWPDWTRLYWLIGAPLAALLLWALYGTRQHSKDWRTILPPAFHAILLKQHTPRQRTFGYLTLALAWLCALLALLGPSWQAAQETPAQKIQQPALVIIIQLTPDMLAKDLAPSRLQRIREKIINLLEKREDASTALVVYAGSAHTLVPLSNDLFTSKNLLQALHPDLMPISGQRADLAIQRALDLLQQGAQGQGQILLISNGVSVSEQMAIQQLLKNTPVQLLSLGVGTLAGAPMVISAQGDLLTDTSGAIVISRLNQTSLQLLSKQTSSRYTPLSSDQTDLKLLGLLNPSNHAQHRQRGAAISTQQDQGYWFILPLLLLAASFARRGSVLIIIVGLLPMMPMPVYAFELENLWLRPDQQGQKLLEQEQPKLAAQRFNDPAWQASAWYLAKDYRRAAEAFALLDTAEAHYNRGNALALLGDFTEALQAYQQALQLAPDMLAAQYNYDVVTEHLKRSQSTRQTDAEKPAQDSKTLLGTPTETLTNSANKTAADVEASRTETQHNATLASPLVESTPASNASPADTPSPHKTTQTSQHAVDLERWLEQVPDDPSELLKRKFLYEQQRQETRP